MDELANKILAKQVYIVHTYIYIYVYLEIYLRRLKPMYGQIGARPAARKMRPSLDWFNSKSTSLQTPLSGIEGVNTPKPKIREWPICLLLHILSVPFPSLFSLASSSFFPSPLVLMRPRSWNPSGTAPDLCGGAAVPEKASRSRSCRTARSVNAPAPAARVWQEVSFK